jgi:very-short-patch-repair endonuclease
MTGEFKPRNTLRAKALRSQATPAERLLWTALSNRKVDGYKFSRQMPVGPYFADFLCRDAKLAVELDGFSHDMNQEYDGRRDAFMVKQGCRLLRFNNADVMNDLEGVVRTVALALAEIVPPPTPPASGRGVEMTRPLC